MIGLSHDFSANGYFLHFVGNVFGFPSDYVGKLSAVRRLFHKSLTSVKNDISELEIQTLYDHVASFLQLLLSTVRIAKFSTILDTLCPFQ